MVNGYQLKPSGGTYPSWASGSVTLAWLAAIPNTGPQHPHFPMSPWHDMTWQWQEQAHSYQYTSRPRKKAKKRQKRFPIWEWKGKHPSLNEGLYVMSHVIFLTMVLGREVSIFFSTLFMCYEYSFYDSIVTETITNFQKISLCSLM